MAEEVAHLSRELELREGSVEGASREKEKLTKERADLAVRLEGAEREIRSLNEALATLKVDRSNLEMALFESQQALAMVETRKENLEKEKDDLIEKKRSLQGRSF